MPATPHATPMNPESPTVSPQPRVSMPHRIQQTTRCLVLPLSLALWSCSHAQPQPQPHQHTAPADSQPDTDSTRFNYPKTRVFSTVVLMHGVTVLDRYRWLEEDSSEVQEWSRAQDQLTRSFLGKLPDVGTILEQLKTVSSVPTKSAPTRKGERLFYWTRAANEDRARVVWRHANENDERVLLDSSQWSTDGHLSLGGWTVSPDGKWVAFEVRVNNSDSATLRVASVDSGKVDESQDIAGVEHTNVAWTPQSDGFYYEWTPTSEKLHPIRSQLVEIRYHTLGTPTARDKIVYSEPDTRQIGRGVSLSADGRWLFVRLWYGWSSVDIKYMDLRARSPQFRDLIVGTSAVNSVVAFGNRFYLRTNLDAPNGKVYEIDPMRPERSSWRELIPERATSPLLGFGVVGGRLALTYLDNVVAKIELRNLDGQLLRTLDPPDLGRASGPWGEENVDEAYYSYESFTIPPTTVKTSIARGGTEVWYTQTTPADFSPYVTEQRFAVSKDGTKVPMFIVHRRAMELNGDAPTWLTGYGGFNSPYLPRFDGGIVPWLERGGVYVVANTRGGSEYGESWHRGGMGRNKQNVFDDFIAAAELLIRERWTSPTKLAISGASNGGLLVAAAATQRPDLFAAVLCDVPLADMIRYPIYGRDGVAELGDPEDTRDFAALYKYSPVHRVVPNTRYPAFLVTVAEKDERAHPMHGRKLAAALQAASTGGPVLLRVDWNTGHMGADSVEQRLERRAQAYAFALSQMR